MKLIDDLKSASTNGSHTQGLNNDFVLLLCEAVEALDGVVEQDFWDFLDADGSEVEARDRASAVLDKLRSYAP